MHSTLQMARRWHARYVAALSLLQHPFLLACRLYWGGTFVFTGFSKLTHLALTADKFAGWHIPAPYANAVAAGTTELVCGSLLVLGVASRIITVPLIVTMIVAYLTAHADEVTGLYSFVTAPPFLNLLTCVLVLLFGPGVFSVDYLVSRFVFWLENRSAGEPGFNIRVNDSRPRAAKLSERNAGMTSTSRRQFNQLALAAFSGALAGSILGCSADPQAKPDEAKTTGTSDKPATARTGKTYDENLLLAGDPHVCRGLNQCKNQGRTKTNDCAGQGACATAEKHACDGLNSCKGQGGCGEHPGQNQCKGQGGCAVTLKDKTWQKARAKFAELMAAKNRKVGPAPEKG